MIVPNFCVRIADESSFKEAYAGRTDFADHYKRLPKEQQGTIQRAATVASMTIEQHKKLYSPGIFIANVQPITFSDREKAFFEEYTKTLETSKALWLTLEKGEDIHNLRIERAQAKPPERASNIQIELSKSAQNGRFLLAAAIIDGVSIERLKSISSSALKELQAINAAEPYNPNRFLNAVAQHTGHNKIKNNQDCLSFINESAPKEDIETTHSFWKKLCTSEKSLFEWATLHVPPPLLKNYREKNKSPEIQKLFRKLLKKPEQAAESPSLQTSQPPQSPEQVSSRPSPRQESKELSSPTPVIAIEPPRHPVNCSLLRRISQCLFSALSKFWSWIKSWFSFRLAQ